MSHKGEGEENRLVLLMLGRDDLLLSAYLNWSAGPSGTYMSTWRNGESLRVRLNSLESGSISRISVAEKICRYGGMEVSGWPTRSHSVQSWRRQLTRSRRAECCSWGGACTILFGLGSLVAILLRTTRLDLPVIRIAEVFIAIGLLSIVAGLALRAREAKGSRVRHG